MQLKRITLCIALAFAPNAFAAETATLPEIQVTAEKLQPLPALSDSALGETSIARQRASTSDTAKLLDGQPGVSLSGAVSAAQSLQQRIERDEALRTEHTRQRRESERNIRNAAVTGRDAQAEVNVLERLVGRLGGA